MKGGKQILYLIKNFFLQAIFLVLILHLLVDEKTNQNADNCHIFGNICIKTAVRPQNVC